ncbi:hypothetical protein V1512DRAFT_246359 [Lipomyces arxii]|uniref:uncharacterized protein n=1 Tax=Lipomyces arxii TaxID=56418 RepID=UPI0034CE1CA4
MSTSPAATEFESLLQSMLELRAPGVSGSKIRSLTEIAMQNVESESVLIQKLYTHFKRAPIAHKLGALYVVDAIARAYQDECRKLGQVPSATSPEGTPAAAVYHLSGMIDSLMADITSAPADQRDKIGKVIDIWERAATFSPELLASMRSKFVKLGSENSTTPPYPPPAHLLAGAGAAPAASTAQSTTSILNALATMAKQNDGTPVALAPAAQVPAPSAPSQPSFTDASSIVSALSSLNGRNGTPDQKSPMPQQDQFSALASVLAKPPPQQQGSSYPSQQNQPNVPDMASILPFLNSGAQQQPFPPQPQPSAIPFSGFQMPAPQQAPGAPGMEQQIALMQLLISQGMPINQIAMLLQAAGGNGAAAGAIPTPSAQGSLPTWQPPDDDRGRGSSMRSPPYDSNQRRSRSPRNRRRSRSPSYRGRSPRGNRRSESPPARRRDVEIRPKQVSYDPTMPADCIKVLSRTLFVGGVPSTMSEDRLIAIFEQAVRVQGVIMNKDKRCAFLKVYYRSDAEQIKATMETYQSDDVTLRCRWGVGFGPRDCCDYASGVSTIPIGRLTEADKRWVTTAEFGGTGGRAIEPGLVVEEPDIEIGAGVSSKAISKRMPTNSGGDLGPKSTDEFQFAQKLAARQRRPARRF